MGIVHALKDVLHDGGVRVFWRGSSMRLGRLVLSGELFPACGTRLSRAGMYRSEEADVWGESRFLAK